MRFYCANLEASHETAPRAQQEARSEGHPGRLVDNWLQLVLGAEMTVEQGGAVVGLRGLDWCFLGSSLCRMECLASVEAEGGGALHRPGGSSIDGVYGPSPPTSERHGAMPRRR